MPCLRTNELNIMTERFLHLERQEQAEIYQTMEERLQRNAMEDISQAGFCWSLGAEMSLSLVKNTR